jgi:hypothetical protein
MITSFTWTRKIVIKQEYCTKQRYRTMHKKEEHQKNLPPQSENQNEKSSKTNKQTTPLS